jgi:hypothetical protein
VKVAEGVRFRPPRVPPGPELDFVLARAFGPTVVRPFGPLEPAAILGLARALDLEARIGARHPADRLVADTDPRTAEAFARASREAVANQLQLQAVARDVARVAADLGLPLVLLKFAALAASGAVSRGARRASDLDVLVDPARATLLRRTLLSQGYADSDLRAQEQELSALRHPSGRPVEIHRLMLGVRLQGRGSATVPGLAEQGLLVSAPDLPGEVFVPRGDVCMAHAVVHGIAQHGGGDYPFLRVVGDVIDLGGAAAPQPLPAWIAADVSPQEWEATLALARSLAAGRGLALLGRICPPEGLLLRHVVAAATDLEYRRALKLLAIRRPLTDRPRGLARALTLARGLWLTATEIDAVYGRPGSRLGYLARRMARPFDLAGRALRAFRGQLAVRRRQEEAPPE